MSIHHTLHLLKNEMFGALSGPFRILTTVFLISFAALSNQALSKNTNIMRVEAMGSTPVTLQTGEADTLAREDAFKKAVAKAVESLLPREAMDKSALILDDKIYSNAVNYIVNFRVLSRETLEDEIPVTEGGVPIFTLYIEADIAVDSLKRDLIEAGIIREKEVKSILITLTNPGRYKTFETFKRHLKALKGVKEIHYKSFSGEKIELIVETHNDIQALTRDISLIDMKGWQIEASLVSSWFGTDRIDIKLVPHYSNLK